MQGDEGGYDLDAQTVMSISFLEAALGSKKQIKYERVIPCPSCSGSGCSKGHKLSICTKCKGSGNVS
jgi:molecular chaperone DnaJ